MGISFKTFYRSAILDVSHQWLQPLNHGKVSETGLQFEDIALFVTFGMHNRRNLWDDTRLDRLVKKSRDAVFCQVQML